MKTNNSINPMKYFIYFLILIIAAKFIFDDGLIFLRLAFRPIIIASIFIYLFGPLANYIDRKTKLNRVGSVIAAYVALILLIALFVILIVPSILDSISLMITNVSAYDEEEVIAFVNNIPIIASYLEADTISELVSRIEEIIVYYSSSILQYSTGFISSVGSLVYSIIIYIFALLMSFYAIIDTDHIGEKLMDILEAFLPKKIAAKTIRVLELMDDAIRKYLVSKSYTCIILGIMITLTIYIVNLVTPLEIPYAVLMGFLIAISNFIPYIGFFFGTLPCVVIAAFSGFPEAIGIFIIINAVQQIDNLIISPKIIGDKVGVKPFWVLSSVIVGGSLFGIIGMIISIPVISVILHLIEEHVEEHKKNHPKEDGHSNENNLIDSDNTTDSTKVESP